MLHLPYAMKILVVCLGNICRSPIAEGVLQHLAQAQNLSWQIDSAGTNGFHTEEHPHKSSIKVCASNGIDISKQVSRKFTKDDFKNYDLILVMAKDVYKDVQSLAKNTQDMQNVKYYLDSLYPNTEASVTDPWYGDEDGYIPVFEQINEAAKAWIKLLAH
jgi:protein-tyrosine phosphatase